MIPYFDGHCDTVYESYMQNRSLLAKNPKGHLDLERIEKQFAPYAQFFAIYEDAEGKESKELDLIFKKQYDIFQQGVREQAARVQFCRSGQEAEASFAAGKAAAFLSVEGADLIGCSLDGLERAYTLGVRAVNLTWNRANSLSGSAVEEKDRGLSPLGRAYVKRMQELGMLVDVSHLSDPGFWDVAHMAEKPFFASHSNVRAVWNHPRNLSDEQFSAIVSSGGVAGLNLYAGFLGEKPDFDTILAHLEHFWALGGEEHVAIGGDWDGCDTLPNGFEDGVSGMARLYDWLLSKHYSETLLEQLFFKNLMRVVDQVCTM